MIINEYRSYKVLDKLGYKREAVKHSIEEYVRREVHVDSCEDRASLIRPWLSKHMEYQKTG